MYEINYYYHNINGDIMKKKSIWIDTSNVKNRLLPSLNKDIECDILVIGGGISGLSTSYFLKDSKKKIVLIDKDKIGYGVTSHNTGKLTFMQELVYSKIESNYNKEVAKRYLDSQIEAIKLITKIIKDNKIECHLEKTSSYVFSNKEEDKEDFDKEISFYKDNNIKVEDSNLPFNVPYKLSIKTEDSYVFNPYEYLVGLKNILKDKIDIYEKTRCTEVDKVEDYYIITTDKGYKIKTKVVVVSSHYPMFIIPYFTPFKTKVERFFIGASSCDKYDKVQSISYNNPSLSLRYYKDNNNYLIYGRRGRSVTSHLDVREDLKELKDEYKKYFDKDLDYFYHTHDLMSFDNMPLIGEVDSNLYIMTGFNKWGNTNGTIGGKVISDLIEKKENRYVGIFNPKRGISYDKIKNLLIYNIDVGTRYIINKIKSSQDYYDDRVRIEVINGKKYGIYKDDKNIEHIVSNICPHMKCNLIFNYVDKTWDCPCHGSRFDIDGNIIYGPSVYNIKIDKNGK